VFAGVQDTDAADVLNFAKLYDESADGWIEDARPLGRLRFCLKTRVPAL
jgi:predicted metal-binding protein